jgi:hypothetical protein
VITLVLINLLQFQGFLRQVFTTTRARKPLALVCVRHDHHWSGNELLEKDDPEMYDLIRQEKERQRNGLELIASEVSSLKRRFVF